LTFAPASTGITARRSHAAPKDSIPFSHGLAVSTLLTVSALAGPGASAARASSGYDVHQGIDKCGDQKDATVDALWTGTPFYNYGLYLGGAQSGWVSCTSSASFVSYVRNKGFGLMPLWDDLQAPCSSAAKKMSSNTTTARSQGVSAANAAKSTAAADGFTLSDVLWLDMEKFDESNASCKAAVHAYIDGWDSVLNTLTDAGIYVNPANAVSLLSLTNKPDFAWFSVWDVEVNSVWGISGVPNSDWLNDRRIHQYRGPKPYHLPWGCTSNCTITVSVDVDCVNGWIAEGNDTSDNDSAETNEANSPTAEPTCNAPAQ
jgi:hypothetical protein